jgi:pimeloyl-ACP methyl ester carboxylesterase
MPETQLYFNSDRYNLFGVLYTPGVPGAPAGRGYVLCHPFAEEKKAAQTVLVQIARVLCERGFPVLVFDLRGCGDSGGYLAEATLTAWREDLQNAAHFFRQQTGVGSLGVVGVRLGAFVCASHPAASALFDQVILIEPVLQPDRYLKQALKGKLVKELLTAGVATSRRDSLLGDLAGGASIDFDGHEISPAFYSDALGQTDAEGLLAGYPGEIVLLSLSLTGRMRGELQKAADRWAAGNGAFRAQVVQIEPFWHLLDTPDCHQLVQTLVAEATSSAGQPLADSPSNSLSSCQKA